MSTVVVAVVSVAPYTTVAALFLMPKVPYAAVYCTREAVWTGGYCDEAVSTGTMFESS